MTTIPINLAAVENLTLLHFEVTLNNIQNDRFSGILTLLGTIRLGNNLKSLHLGIDYINYHHALGSLKEYDGWPTLNNLLGRFQELSDLKIMFYLYNFSPAKQPRAFKNLEREVRRVLTTTRIDREIVLAVVVITWPLIPFGYA